MRSISAALFHLDPEGQGGQKCSGVKKYKGGDADFGARIEALKAPRG